MSRARNLKPKFFKNEDLASLPFEYRILFQGLWCEADREGRLEDRPKRIKAEVFPYDEVDVEAGLSKLHASGFIERYEVNGTKYIQVVAFLKHQNPHCKEAASTIPAQCKPGASRKNTGTSPADSLNPLPDSLIPMQGDARPVPSVASVVIDAYHAALPNCQRVAVPNPKRLKRIAIAVRLARQVCASQGWDYGDGTAFWSSYFGECATDPWMRGEVPNPKNPAWKQNLDVLLAEDRFAGIMDKAIASMRGAE
jgi:hypothetical protein